MCLKNNCIVNICKKSENSVHPTRDLQIQKYYGQPLDHSYVAISGDSLYVSNIDSWTLTVLPLPPRDRPRFCRINNSPLAYIQHHCFQRLASAMSPS